MIQINVLVKQCKHWSDEIIYSFQIRWKDSQTYHWLGWNSCYFQLHQNIVYIYICKNKKHIFTYIQPYTKLIYTHLQCVTLRWRFKRLLFQGSWPRNGMETSPASDDNSDDPMTWNTKSNIRIWNKTKVFEETYPTKNIHWLFKITHLETKQNKSISLRNSFFGWNIKKTTIMHP